jgi:hypothetical protein
MARKTLTLQDINDAADQQYGTVDIPVGDAVVKLVNPLRLSESKRKALRDWLKPEEEKTEEEKARAEADDRPAFEQAADFLYIVAQEAWMADKLKDALRDENGEGDQAKLKFVLEAYFDKEQVGKASSSEN